MTRAAATVYLVTNSANGKTYVGVTRRSIRQRLTSHFYAAARSARTRFHRAIAKYGAEQFKVEPIASCLTLDAAVPTESALIQDLRPEYNQTNGGEFTVGRRASREVCDRIAAANRGKTRTPEQKALNSRLARERYLTNPEWRAKVLAALARGRQSCEPARVAAVARSSKERVWTAESRAKLSASCMGRQHSRDALDRITEKNSKAVLCLTTGVRFGSVSEAAVATGLSISGVSRVCRGTRNSANGLRFEFAVHSKE